MIVLLAGLLAGFLDAAAASILFLSRGNKNLALLFRYIASAVFGKAAFERRGMVVMGVVFHFCIALAFVAIYFGLYPYVGLFGGYPFVSACVYGVVMWMVMNLLVVPYSRAAARPFSLVFAVVNAVILIVAIGMPVAYIARWYYR